MSKKLAENMIPKEADSTQITFCLYVLADKIDWQIFEAEFSKHYRPDQ
ncbi:MAG: hypothetical protein QME58_07250 [Bacteroidota bacterium]|nr:hypothetical protein [Bacteroidota bacterium]